MEKRIRLKKVSSVVNRIKKECCDCAMTKTIFRYQFRQMCQTITSFRNNKKGGFLGKSRDSQQNLHVFASASDKFRRLTLLYTDLYTFNN